MILQLSKQINMKGLDGLQGPIYVGTGCVFRRRALYGFDAPKKKKTPRMTCNCWPKWCFFCCGKSKNRKTKTTDKKKKNREASKQIHALENIEEGTVSNAVKSPEAAQLKLEKKFGQSPVFIASAGVENGGLARNASPGSLLREAIQVISCGYEDKTEWGKEVNMKISFQHFCWILSSIFHVCD